MGGADRGVERPPATGSGPDRPANPKSEIRNPKLFAWHPTPEYVERSRLRRFMEAEGIQAYEDLLRRAVEDPAWFWAAVVRDLGLEFYEPYTQVLDTSAGLPWTRWFTGGRINYVH